MEGLRLPATWTSLQELAQAHPELINQPDPQGYFPLQWAALNNRIACLSWLLEQGAQPDRCEAPQQPGAPVLAPELK